MGTLQRIIVRLTILASIVSAAPIVGNGTRFSVEQVPINQTSPLSGAQHLAHAYRKYAGVVPTIVALAAAKGSVVATPTNAYDSLYVCPVTIGGQTVNLHFDTGSADLYVITLLRSPPDGVSNTSVSWVFSPDLPQAQQTNHKLYDYKKSSTAKLLSRASWSIQYSDETKAGGLVTEDDVVLGGVTVPAQAIEAADTVSPKFVPRPSDGLMGLSLAVNTGSSWLTRPTHHPTDRDARSLTATAANIPRQSPIAAGTTPLRCRSQISRPRQLRLWFHQPEQAH